MPFDDQFELRLGRMAGNKGRPAGSRSLGSRLIQRVNRAGIHPRPGPGSAAAGRIRSGRFNARGRGALIGAMAARASSWSVDPVSRMRVRPRRVTVKARVVKLSGSKVLAGLRAHLRYLQRDGVTREGEPGRFYSALSDEADGRAFLERGEEDRHQFRFIVSPEDGREFEDLRSFTRELMARMEQDLATRLDWVAVDHFDTGHPHSHILLRGVTEEGRILNIAGDYIAHGIRHRASEIMTLRLGPQSELELREQLVLEVPAERLTRLDRSLLGQAREGLVDLGITPPGWDGGGAHQQLLISRARQLERMELATREAPLVWRLSPALKETLSDLGRRGDIIGTLHLAMTAAGLDRRPELYRIDDPAAGTGALVGRVVAAGSADEHHERRFLVVDGIDGRSHYLDIGRSSEPVPVGSLVRAEPCLAGLRPADRAIAAIAERNGGAYSVDLHLAGDPAASEAFAQAHVRRLESLRRSAGAAERQPDGSWTIPADFLDRALEAERRKTRSAPWNLRILSRLELEAQARLDGPTWLDQHLAGGSPETIAAHGFGAEVRQALRLRQQWLVEQGLAIGAGESITCAGDFQARLADREFRRAVAGLGAELGLVHRPLAAGETIAGICRRRVDLASSSYALVEHERAFTLVPWRPVLERRLGREVSGIMRRSGAISWSFGRDRGPEIGL